MLRIQNWNYDEQNYEQSEMRKISNIIIQVYYTQTKDIFQL